MEKGIVRAYVKALVLCKKVMKWRMMKHCWTVKKKVMKHMVLNKWVVELQQKKSWWALVKGGVVRILKSC